MRVLLIGLYCWLSLSQSAYANQSVPVRMYLFYSQDCEDCLAIKDDLIPELNRRYASSLKVRYLEINDPKNYGLMTELEQRYRHELKSPPPTIFIGDQVLDGEREIKQGLEGIVRDYYLKGGCSWPDEYEGRPRLEGRNLIIERFKNLGVLAIIGGGLLDGINPCAFTTLIFFISYLAFVGRKGKQIILVGGIFTLAVFTSYLLVGIGLFEFVKMVTILPFLSRVISVLVAIGAFLLGILNLHDYYRIKRGRLSQACPMSLGKVLAAIKRGSNMRHYLLGALVTGFLISFLEFFCTGQIYFPIIVVFRYVPDLRIHALLYLVLYNLMFILPLIIVFILAYYGITSERIAKLTQRHLGKTKILTAILFFGLAGILVAFNLR